MLPMTTEEPDKTPPRDDDAALVAAALAGERRAFARIVSRYQNLVCAVALGATGDASLAEDLAQETFLNAWRSLPALREPERLRSWLCGIARNLAHGAARRRRREPTAAPGAAMAADAGIASGDEGPAEHVLSLERRAVVGRALARLPDAYREPLILFYWEGHSTERVAAQLELSPDAARQRLARGRAMLRERLVDADTAWIESWAPGKRFTAGVLAALPSAAPETAAAASGLAAAAGKTILGAGLTAGIVGSAIGLGGAVVGARASIAATGSPRERRFMIRAAWRLAGLVAGLLALQAGIAVFAPGLFRAPYWHVSVGFVYVGVLLWLIRRINRGQAEIQILEGRRAAAGERLPRERRFLFLAVVACLAYVAAFFTAQAALEAWAPGLFESAYGQLTLWSLFVVGLMQLIDRCNRRQLAVRAAESASGTRAAANVRPSANAAGSEPRLIRSSLAGGAIGSVLWMLPLCWLARDWLSGGLIVLVALSVFEVASRAAIRQPERYFAIALRQTMADGALVLVAMNLRWETWMAAYRQSSLYDSGADLPLWAMNLLVASVIAWVAIALRSKARALEGTASRGPTAGARLDPG